MTDIDRIFLTTPERQKYKAINQMKNKIDEKRQEGLAGKAMSDATFIIRREMEKIAPGDYVKIKRHQKKLLREHVIETGCINQFVKIHHHVPFDKNIRTTQELVDLANTTNMFAVIFGNLKGIMTDTFFSCHLVSNNFAWISKDDNNVYRYYSKRKGGNTIGLSVFDLLEIIDEDGIDEKRGFHYAKEELARLLDLQNLKDQWVIDQCEKYQSNLRYIRNETTDINPRFPVLDNFMQKYLPILIYLNTKCEEGIFRSFSYHGEHIFFTSTYRIEEMVGIRQSTVSRSINMLTLIGLIEKVPHDKLPSHLLEISDRIMESRFKKGYKGGKGKGGKRITFYRVPKYNKETLESAEEMVKKINESGMWASQISERRVEKVFGVEKAKEVFLPDYQVKTVRNESEESPQSVDIPSIEDYDNIPF
ncbi:hypothetical protein [Brevibacillus brevis]|uniref:hypothetical protein n=1 Tax=Brevibacillus brevis TaxID=1393 RepID=UPI0037C53EF2